MKMSDNDFENELFRAMLEGEMAGIELEIGRDMDIIDKRYKDRLTPTPTTKEIEG
jgi:hypothetical protein